MGTLLMTRQRIISFYKRFESVILPAIKFFAGVIMFSIIGGIGFSTPSLSVFFEAPLNMPFVFLMGILTAFLPTTMFNLLVIINVAMALSSVLEITVSVTLFFVIILLFYARLAPKESLFVVATVFAFYFNMPHIVPLFAGLYFSLLSAIPIAIGTFIWSFTPVIKNLLIKSAMTETSSLDLMELPKIFLELYNNVLPYIKNDREWIVISLIFGAVVFLVNVISKMPINYGRQAAVCCGAFVNILMFTVFSSMNVISTSLLGVVFGTLSAALFMLAAIYFEAVLDYNGAERVTFEDDENYYYVKVIPKAAYDPGNKPK